MKILFVCTGNTCRSVLAQALMNKRCERDKLDIICESAGVSAFVGDRASDNTIEVLREKGIDVTEHRTRRLSEYMADEYDLFICMGQEHLEGVKAIVGEERVRLFGQGIWDPEDDDISIFRLCADKIEREVRALAKELSKIVIRPMTESDISFIAETEKECFSQPWSEAAVGQELKNENAVFFVAEYLCDKVGYMGMHTVLDECYVANVAVVRKYRRRSIGKKLLRYAEERAKERGCSFISLEVRAGNKSAIALYTSEGYEKAGERKNFYSEPKEDALIMTKKLNVGDENNENTCN